MRQMKYTIILLSAFILLYFQYYFKENKNENETNPVIASIEHIRGR